MQSLLGAVVETGNAGQAEETGQAERDLIVILRRIRWVDVADALLHVVIVEESDEVARGVAVGAEYVGFDLLAKHIHADQLRRRREAFHDWLEVEIKRVVEGRIDAHHIGVLRWWCGR